jgi:hypothetical protein
MLNNMLLDATETARRIAAGQALLLAGEEKLLATMPPGKWIGGTIPYFMTAGGGCFCQDKIFVTELPAGFRAVTRAYSKASLPSLCQDAEANEVSFVILPADSSVHAEFASNAPRYPNFASHPVVGWIAGLSLADLGKATPKVFCGSPQAETDAAAVLRLQLPPDRLAQIHIINLFEPGDGATIEFPVGGFSAATARINGQDQNFADYLIQNGADQRLPLVANYCGALVNVSIKHVDQKNRFVDFYAPVFPGIEYRLAAPLTDYVAAFESRLKDVDSGDIVFSCNCILNYLYSQLEGRRTGGVIGPITFGEIAYQLLNQTLVYLTLEKVQ